jgi:hypothetical protein
VSAAAAALDATLVAGLAALHAHWALGGFWPGHDAESLARTVVGGPPGMRGPGPGATWGVVLVLLGAAATSLGAAGVVWLPAPAALVRGAAQLGVAVLVLRGLEGFVDVRLRPATVGSPFARLNVLIYSPLCLVLALLLGVAVRR